MTINLIPGRQRTQIQLGKATMKVYKEHGFSPATCHRAYLALGGVNVGVRAIFVSPYPCKSFVMTY